jgi:pimeloyl-ACP methyl ester carboxylesterase
MDKANSTLQELGWADGSRMRTFGSAGPLVILLHGGPAACGFEDMLVLGENLSSSCRVYDPWQRGSGSVPLSVAQHVSDLLVLIDSFDELPILIGHSWGAMLALIFASAYPEKVSALSLVGCGTFDEASLLELKRLKKERKEKKEPVHSKEKHDDEIPENFDWQAHGETWQDMVRLRDTGIYPAAFSAIKCPVFMLHGGYDPHPGELIYKSLVGAMPQLEYREWVDGGHSPFMEEKIKSEFFEVLREWILRV